MLQPNCPFLVFSLNKDRDEVELNCKYHGVGSNYQNWQGRLILHGAYWSYVSCYIEMPVVELLHGDPCREDLAVRQ
jgi:hypothetical protein